MASLWDAVVTNPDDLSETLADGFTVSWPTYRVYLPIVFSTYSTP